MFSNGPTKKSSSKRGLRRMTNSADLLTFAGKDLEGKGAFALGAIKGMRAIQ